MEFLKWFVNFSITQIVTGGWYAYLGFSSFFGFINRGSKQTTNATLWRVDLFCAWLFTSVDLIVQLLGKSFLWGIIKLSR